MKNKIDLRGDPETLFLNPWREEGLKLLAPPEFVVREVDGGLIEGFAVSAHAEINAKIRSFVATSKRDKTLGKVFESNCVAAVLDRASFRKSHTLARGKLVLSGASATRLLNSYQWENEDAGSSASGALDAYFSSCRAGNKDQHISIESTFLEPDLDFAVECRNTFNFFHFLTETLGQLCVLDDVGFQGNVYFHFPNKEEKHRSFVHSFVLALFPEFSGRVHFERAPKDYDVVLTAYDFRGAICQMPEAALSEVTAALPQGMAAGDLKTQPVLAMNSTGSALNKLRHRALSRVSQSSYEHLPKRFFVGRSEEQSRDRPLVGQSMLMRQLEEFGFEYVVFEDLTPLEQIALMAQAEIMISAHGAGFANMLFAAPTAYVIELGTLQTAIHRWADFWPLAHTAQCRYISFFADFNSDDPLREPRFSEDGILPTSLSEDAVLQIRDFVGALLGEYSQVSDTDRLLVLGRRVLRAGGVMQAIALLDLHSAICSRSSSLSLLRADCHKTLDEPKSELVALEQAYHADPMRWQTLVRIIWCANRCARPQVVRWALALLEADFPDRHEAFVANHEWVLFVS